MVSNEVTKAVTRGGNHCGSAYKALSAEQQRLQKITWADQQAAALDKASSALDDYAYKVERGITLGPFADQYSSGVILSSLRCAASASSCDWYCSWMPNCSCSLARCWSPMPSPERLLLSPVRSLASWLFRFD